MSAEHREREALQRATARYERLGYKIIIDPAPEIRPSFLGEFRPDAIAIGKQPNVVIEVVEAPGGGADLGLYKIRSLLESRDDWRLDVIYLSHADQAGPVPKAKDVEEIFGKVQLLAQQEPGFGIVILWSLAEGLARKAEPQLAARTLSASALVDLLVSNGYASQEEGSHLRDIATVRNRIVHGDVGARPGPEEMNELVEVVRRLLDRSRANEIVPTP